MAKYIPTREQIAALEVSHNTRKTAQSIVNLIDTGKGIDRVLVRRYVSHDVDTTGIFDTVAVFFVDLIAGKTKTRGYATFAFNVVNGIPIAADFRDYRLTVEA